MGVYIYIYICMRRVFASDASETDMSYRIPPCHHFVRDSSKVGDSYHHVTILSEQLKFVMFIESDFWGWGLAVWPLYKHPWRRRIPFGDHPLQLERYREN